MSSHQTFEFRSEIPTEEAAVLDLYAAVGWAAYTRQPAVLMAALAGSTWGCAAWQGPRLMGLVRVVSDDASIAYIQDILVHPEAQRAGLGRRLMQAALDRFAHCRQKVLITDDEPRQRAFYEALGFTEGAEVPDGPVRTFVIFGQPRAPG